MEKNTSNNRFDASVRKTCGHTQSVLQNTLACSLEELYKGGTKEMKITRPSGKVELLNINLKPGFRHGTKLTYKELGDRSRDGTPTDLVFVIQEKQHPVYKRDSNDLIVTKKITLLEALTGGDLDLTTLDGRHIKVPLADDVILAPGDEMVVPGEGMPIASQPGVKGNLRIKFVVKFPRSSLTEEQRLKLKRGLGGDASSL